MSFINNTFKNRILHPVQIPGIVDVTHEVDVGGKDGDREGEWFSLNGHEYVVRAGELYTRACAYVYRDDA